VRVNPSLLMESQIISIVNEKYLFIIKHRTLIEQY